MKTLFSFFIVVFLSINLFAQPQVISGTVVDQQTGEPLAGATIKHLSSGKQVMTDFDGNFSLPVGVNGITGISVSYVSYKEIQMNRVKVSNEEQPAGLNIKMRRVGSPNSENELATARPHNNPTS